MGTKSTHQASATAHLPDSTEVFKDKSELTLGQILSHIFEKAINVQYQEYQGKLQNNMKEFFFSNNDNHLYTVDLKLAKFWKESKPKEKESIWTTVNAAQNDVIEEIKKSDLYAKAKHCDDIVEENENDNDTDGSA